MKTEFDTIDKSILKSIGAYGEFKVDYADEKLFLDYPNQDPLELKKTSDGIYKNEHMNFEIKILENRLEIRQSEQLKTFYKNN